MNNELNSSTGERRRPAVAGRFSTEELAEIRRGFVPRLRSAFNNANNAEIARRLKTTDATIKAYTDGNRLPVPELLLEITRVTGINIHWLLTGEGPKRIERENLFSEEETAEIERLAMNAGRSFEEEVRALTLGAAELRRKI